ncbi:TPA: hypothetical protein N0F65_009786 [Lagenidium giganteum]|uniref:ABC transporter domain-containing protein n=1 Tax=Lagenidium giganteum TaxID=4803 RepID=A0AAV2YUP5_9STRA|nr:TPA: hypothetical protein N0F65_009786 [Lagenidium giganteum]
MRTLLWKNWLLKRRHPIATAAEVLLPVIFIIIMNLLKRLSTDTTVPAGWSQAVTFSDTNTTGVSFGLFDTPGPRYIMPETTMPGLLMLMATRMASELRNLTQLAQIESLTCAYGIGYFGAVSTNVSSPMAVPPVCRDRVTPYKLAIVPDNTFTRQYFFETLARWYPRTPISADSIQGFSPVVVPALRDSVVFFDSNEALEAHITDPKIYAALVFDRMPSDDAVGTYTSVEYSIRMNSTLAKGGTMGTVPRTTGGPASEFPFQRQLDKSVYPRYAVRGFMTLQTLVARFLNCMPEWNATSQTTTDVCKSTAAVAHRSDELDRLLWRSLTSDLVVQNVTQILATQLNMTRFSRASRETLLAPMRIAPQPILGATVVPFPVIAYVSAPFYDQVSRVLVVLIQEKETRAREYMKILGVPDTAILSSWYVTYMALFLVASILQTIASHAALFHYSQPVVIFVFFYLFSLSVLAFGFLMSTLFSRSRTGAFAGIVVFFLMYFVSKGFSESATVRSKATACLLSPSTAVGMSWSNTHVLTDNFRFATALGMLLLDTLLYTLVGLYLDKVVPREFGTSEKWDFLFSPSYWRRSKLAKVDDAHPPSMDAVVTPLVAPNANIEAVSAELAQQERTGDALVLRDLYKSFTVPGGTEVAVKGVNLAMYKDQITCLLGHNGAGKSTVISMLTGMVAPTRGDATFRGLSLTRNLRELRQSLGLCFQHDVLYGELTVEEHLKFYARVKGYTAVNEVADVVNAKIVQVGLTDKRHVAARALSGGMKRKLSLAISLLGDSALVFLDEPTSGMDPYSRRSTWEMLLSNRTNRVMVLTTHFMDEADILGDRIAIMAEGKLRCCGSSLFLKNRYGAGYNLTLVKQDQCDVQQLMALVATHVPNARVLSHVGSEIAFQLPLEASTAFATMFESLDQGLGDLGVLSYGVSVTTMEEVFIKVAEAGDENQQHTLDKTKAPNASTQSQNLHGAAMFAVHLSALLRKRFRIAKRDRRVLIFSALLPILLLRVGLGLLQTSSLIKPDIKLPLTTQMFAARSNISVPFYCAHDEGEWCSTVLASGMHGHVQASAVNPETFGDPSTSARTTAFGVTYTPPTYQANDTDGSTLRLSEVAFERGFALSATATFNQHGALLVHASRSTQLFGYNVHVNTTVTHGSIVLKTLMDQALYQFFAGGGVAGASATDVTLTANAFPLPFTSTTKAIFSSFLSFTACLFIMIAFAFFPASIAVFLVREKAPGHNSKHQQLVSGVSLPAFWLANYVWDLTTYVVPFIAAIVMIKVFDISALTGVNCNSCTNETFPAVVLLFALFGIAICPFTYCLTFLLRDHASSQTYTILVNFVLGVVLTVVSFILDILNTDSAAANKVLKFFWRFSPLYCLGNGLLNLSIQEIKYERGVLQVTDPSPFDMDAMGWELLYLAIDAVLYLTVSVGLDVLFSFPKIKAAIFKDPVIKDGPYEEEDGGADLDAVIVKQVRKVYAGNKVAVRNVSFGLPKGECFGYLGINGAGKTTTMKMMTGDILPTSGGGKLGGFDILSQQIEVRRLIGYCPQFDALFELLSVREHLELFAQIKGVTTKDLDTVVRDLMHQMNLDDFELKLAGTLSGGNKRKLSVAIALIGSPPIIFLDEPSTGMDPVSRRFMWNVIADISTTRKESTIILTTHSMEECEALCTRVGIMVGGRMRCLGSVQHLKNRFGNGLMVELKLEQPTATEVETRTKASLGENASLITKGSLKSSCERMSNAGWAEKITPKHSTGYALDAVLARDGGIRPQLFCAWWIAEERFAKLDEFLRKSFGGEQGVQLLERQNELCRYKLTGAKENLKLSAIFRTIEGGKATNHVREYAVSQTTLEQIFNSFASQQSEEKGVARGFVQKPT